MSQVIVEKVIDPALDPDWDHTVQNDPSANPMLFSGWHSVLSVVFDVELLFAKARHENGSVGIIATFASTSFLTGKALNSMDGAIAGTSNVEVKDALIEWAILNAKERNLDYCQFKCIVSATFAPVVEQKVYSIIDLAGGSSHIWRTLKSNTRRKVRRSMSLGYVAETSSQVPPEFNSIFIRRQRDLGTPAPSSSLFDAMNAHLEKHMIFNGVYVDGRLCGGAISLLTKSKMLNLYVAVEPRAQKNYASYLLYWSMIKTALSEGVVCLDLGRSTRDSGTHRFKGQWQSNEVDKPYSFVLLNLSSWRGGLDQSRGLKHRIWRTLPTIIAGPLGAILRRKVPFS